MPVEQQPLEEYRQLLASWFFVWPVQSSRSLLKPLAISWLLALPLCLLIAYGSWPLRHAPLRLVLAAAVAAVLPSLLLLTRQWLGWSYVNRRLTSERVEY